LLNLLLQIVKRKDRSDSQGRIRKLGVGEIRDRMMDDKSRRTM
jgi:hypothetical protein